MDTRCCRGCLSPLPSRRWVWCGIQCQRFTRYHPRDFRRIFRWCRYCGIEIDDRPTNVKFCGTRCSQLSKLPERAVSCAICQSDLPGDANPRAIYCSSRCRNIAYGATRAEPLPKATCALPECGITFQPWKTGQRCCSEKHSKLLYNRESRADGRQKPGEWNDKRRDSYHRRRALKKAAATGKPVLFAEIAERDRWRCCLCKKAVNPAVKWPHPKSPSLDHLVPLSKGGAHDPSNVALAHLGCNSAKNNRGGGEQLLLVG